MTGAPQALDEWMPCALVQQQRQWLCRWLSAAGQGFTEPFFSETIQRCKSRFPNGSRFASLSSLDCLAASATAATDAAPPSAFIFHVSRCGSTLLSQMLCSSPKNIVLSEVPLIDELLRLPLQHGEHLSAVAQAALRASIALLGRRRSGQENHLFVKLDSWHIFFAATLRALYPTVPFALLYRAPQEVARSHRQRRGMQSVPGLLEPALFGMSASEAAGCEGDAYIGRVLAYYLSRFAAISAQDDRSILLNYRQGSMSIVRRLTEFCGKILSDDEVAAMQARSRFHSKYPDRGFAEEARDSPATEHIASAQAWYERLEQMRLEHADARNGVTSCN